MAWPNPFNSMKFTHRVAVVGLLALVIVLSAPAQEQTQPAATPAAAPTTTPAAIAAANIPARAERTNTLTREITKRTESDTTADNIEGQLTAEIEKISARVTETATEIERGVARSVLGDTDKTWQRMENRLEGWLQTISQRVSVIDEDRARLKRERTDWDETLKEARDADLPPAVVGQIREVLGSIDILDTKLTGRRERLLTLQTAVSEQKARVTEARRVLKETIADQQESFVRINSPPLWAAIGQASVPDELAARISETRRANIEAVRTYLRDESAQVMMHGVLFVVILGLVLFYRRRVLVWVRQDASLKKAADLLQRPVASALLLSVIFDGWIHPRAPQAWIQMTGTVMILCALRLLPRILPSRMRPGLYMLVVFFVMHRLLETIPTGNLLYRLVLLTLSVVAFGGFFWLSRQLAHGHGVLSARWNRMASAGARFSVAAFALAIVANVVGNVALASLLEYGTLAAFFWAILLWAGAQVVNGMVAAELKTSGAHALRMVRFHSDTIRHFADQTITIVAVVLWLATTLDAFSIREQTVAWIRAAVGAEFTIIGNVTFVPINFVVFPLVIWLSFQLSRLLRFVLETDVLPRVEFPRGVSAAVSKGTHYAILLTGIVVASLASKIPLDRLTIIVGALGVGIGFGLQNVVNNFVSGLILLFERPIQVGDKIQFGTYAGTVTEIGIRASTVRTWQGADVIVPNANLVSSEVTNWVRTDQQRRIEIPIGVAYGTDPEVVLELLRGVAEAHEQVLDDPEPSAIFKGFGDSALNFELRCWTTEDFVRVASDLGVGISHTLAEADITIPFPQRDIHLRTEHEKASPVVPQTHQPDPPDKEPGRQESTRED